MRPNLRPVLSRLVALAACTSMTGLVAQATWNWPEKPQNLKVLPKDFTGQKLRPVMIGFTRALGVRCSYCHVGNEGKPLDTYDFVSDANPNKERAREMYRMLDSINERLKRINSSGDQRVNMWCHTCHQGRPRPKTLEEELNEAYRKAGVTASVARYHELRERYYGRGGYDFGEASLNAFGYELLGKKDREGAIAVLRLNAEEFPLSGNVWDSLAEAYLTSGKKVLAEIYYRKALELDPQNANALEKLVQLREGSEAPATAAGVSTNRNVTVQKTLAPEKQLQFDVEIPAGLDDVWAALTTSEGMKTWIAPDARVDLRVGGDWLVLFPGAAPGGGRITAFAPPTELVIHAMAPERFPEVRSRGTSAAFTLARCGPACTNVRLTQTGWQSGKEWDEAFEYLSNGNAALLEQLRRRFVDGPLKWSP